MTTLLDYGPVLNRFRGLRPDPPTRDYADAECPVKKHANARVRFWTRGETLLFGCYGGCAKCDILRAVGLTRPDGRPDWSSCFPPDPNRRTRRMAPQSKVVAVYPYRDEAGVTLYQCLRYEPGFDGLRKKDLRYRRPARPDDPPERVKRGWVNDLEGVRRVLYRLPQLLREFRQPVVVCEGEKKVDLLRSLCLTATCNPCGALAWQTEYAGYLSGRRVVVFPDANENGQKHALAVAASCLWCDAESIRIVQLPGIADGQGVDDFLAARAVEGMAPEQRKAALVELVKAAPEWRPQSKGTP